MSTKNRLKETKSHPPLPSSFYFFFQIAAMNQDKRSLSVDTLSEFVAQMQTFPSQSSNIDSSYSPPDDNLGVQYILLSCTLNATVSPTEFQAEVVPIETPDHVRQVQSCTETDLYFLRWVFEGCFETLTKFISKNYSRYKILRAEPERDISWAEFREGRRGFLIWLVHTSTRDDPLAALRDLLQTTEPGVKVSDREALLASLVAKQVGVVRRQMRQFYKEIEETERQMSQIWSMVSQSGLHDLNSIKPVEDENDDKVSAAGLTARSLATSSNNQVKLPAPLTEYQGGEGASEWSVVDEDEDRELTSLSGYDSASDRD